MITDELAKAAAAAGDKSSDNGEAPEDVEDRVGEEAKLGISKSVKPRGATKIAGDTTHTTRSAVRSDVAIPTPAVLWLASCRRHLA